MLSWGTCLEYLSFLTLGLCLGQVPGAGGLQHRYECGNYSMQLLVFPSPGRIIHFKVVDEFGTRLEVVNCSVCLHWVTSKPKGSAIFSAHYRGCHVLKKDGHYHLRVFIEEILDARVDEAEDVTLICPKPEHPKIALPHLVAPSPGHPAPSPGHPAPSPGHPAPSPGHPAPSPGHPAPSPGHPAPSPGHPAPSPGHPAPSPGHPAPSPGHPAPSPGHPAPSPTWIHPSPPRELNRSSVTPVINHNQRLAYIHPTWSSPSSLPDTWLEEIASPFHTGSTLNQKGCQDVSDRIPCAQGRSSEACLLAGCCYDNEDARVPCYYGNTATVQCLQDGHFVLVVSRIFTSAKQVGLGSIKLAYASGGCAPTHRTENFVLFNFTVTQCGTTLQVINNQLIYENQLVSDIDIQRGPEGSITRDSTFLLHARCIYNASDFLPVQMEVILPPSPIPVLQSGPFHLDLQIAKNQNYSSYYYVEDFPIFKMLREPVYVEVRLLKRTDPSLVLVLHHCWATPSPNPFKEPQWPLLFDGCPFTGDSYRTQLVPQNTSELPFPTHSQRFIITTFTFVDSNSQRALRGPVYFFCSASACSLSKTEICRTMCHSGATKKKRFVDHRTYREGPQDIVGSPGPISFGDSRDQKINLKNKGGSSSWNKTLKPLMWVTLSLMVITLFLVVAALFGRTQKLQEGRRECDRSQ